MEITVKKLVTGDILIGSFNKSGAENVLQLIPKPGGGFSMIRYTPFSKNNILLWNDNSTVCSYRPEDDLLAEYKDALEHIRQKESEKKD